MSDQAPKRPTHGNPLAGYEGVSYEKLLPAVISYGAYLNIHVRNRLGGRSTIHMDKDVGDYTTRPCATSSPKELDGCNLREAWDYIEARLWQDGRKDTRQRIDVDTLSSTQCKSAAKGLDAVIAYACINSRSDNHFPCYRLFNKSEWHVCGSLFVTVLGALRSALLYVAHNSDKCEVEDRTIILNEGVTIEF